MRREAGYCGIEWGTASPAADQVGHFSLSGKLTAGQTSLVVGDAKAGDDATTGCQEDYVLIPGGTGGTDPTSLAKDRYCGQVTRPPPPFPGPRILPGHRLCGPGARPGGLLHHPLHAGGLHRHH